MESIGNRNNKKDQIRDDFLKSIEKFKLTNDPICKIADLDSNWFSSYLNNNKNIHELPMKQIASLSNLSFMLSNGITLIDMDSRLKAIIDILTDDNEFNISYETIGLYSGIEIEDIKKFMTDTNLLEIDKKYKLSMTVLFLHYIFKK